MYKRQVDNRNLRAIIHNITGGVFLTKAEYIEICKIIDVYKRQVLDSAPFIVPKAVQEKGLDEKSYGGNSALMKAFCDKAVPCLLYTSFCVGDSSYSV